MQLKKILSIFLVVALIASVCLLTVNAENNDIFKVGVEAETATPISTSPNIIKTGEEVTFTIKASQNTGVSYLRFKVSYDTDLFEFVKINDSKSKFHANESIRAYNGYLIYFTYDYSAPVKAVGDVFSFTLKAKTDNCGDAAVSISLVQGNANNCAVTIDDNSKIVPFVSEAYTTAIHNINADDGVVAAPKCEEEGYTTYTCDICKNNTIKGNIVASVGHTEAVAVVENYVESTCTAEGSYDTVVYCKDCNEELSRETNKIAQKQHIPDEAKKENVKDATCTAEGSYDEVVYCSVCNEKLSSAVKIIEKKAHTWGEATVVAPEYKKDGYTVHNCSVCKTEEKYDIVPALTYILGDVNADEVIDDSDAIYLLYATLGMEGYVLNQTADFNGDGEVTDADAIHLLYHTLLGAEEFPLADIKEAKQ